MTHRIAVVGGDGIGPEVIDEAVKVVTATGTALPPKVLANLQAAIQELQTALKIK